MLRGVSSTNKYSLSAGVFFSFFLSLFLIFFPSSHLLAQCSVLPEKNVLFVDFFPLKIDLGISGNFSVVDIEAAGNRGGRHLRKRFTALPSGLVT